MEGEDSEECKMRIFVLDLISISQLFTNKNHSPNAGVQINYTDPLCVVDDVFQWSYHRYEKKIKLVYSYE